MHVPPSHAAQPRCTASHRRDVAEQIVPSAQSTWRHGPSATDATVSTLQSLETVGGRAETVGFYETVLGDPTALFTKLEAYRRVTRGDLLRVARRYLGPEQRTIVVVRPSGDDDEASDDVASEDEVQA